MGFEVKKYGACVCNMMPIRFSEAPVFVPKMKTVDVLSDLKKRETQVVRCKLTVMMVDKNPLIGLIQPKLFPQRARMHLVLLRLRQQNCDADVASSSCY